MSTIDFDFEELALGGGAARASGTAGIRFGGDDYEIMSITYNVLAIEKIATNGFVPLYEDRDLPKSHPLFTMIVAALRDQYDDHIWDLCEGKSDYSQHSTLNHSQQGIDR